MYHLSKNNNNRRNSNSWDTNGVSSDESSDRPWDECESSTIQAKKEKDQREKERREKEEQRQQRERYYEYQKQRQQRIVEEEKQRRELEERKKRRHQARNEAEQNRRKSIPNHKNITTQKNNEDWHQQQRRQQQVVQKLAEQRESPQKKKKQQNSPFREKAATSNNTSRTSNNNNIDDTLPNSNSEVLSSIAHYSNQIMNTIQSSWTGTVTTTTPSKDDELQQQDANAAATTSTPPRPTTPKNRRFTEVLIGTDEEEIIERIYTPDRKLYIRPNTNTDNTTDAETIDLKPTSTKSTTELSPNSDKDSLFGFDSFVKERTTPTRGGTSPSSFNNDDDNSSMDATMHIQTTEKKKRCNKVLWSIMSIIIIVVITVGILFWLQPSILFQNNKSIDLENDGNLEQDNEEPNYNNDSSSSSITTRAPITALPSSQEEIVTTPIPSTQISSNETITSVPTYSFNFTQDMFLPTTTPSSSSSSLQPTSSFPSSSSPTTAVPSLEPTSIPTTSMPSFLPSFPPTTVSPTFAPSSSPSEEESSSLQYDGFAFYLMGDVPYAPWEELVLQEQLENMTSTYNSSYHLFTIHVGDFQKPKRNQCRESMYRNFRSQLLRYGPVPTYVLAGDNDWIDCPNPQDAIQHYRNYFVYDDYVDTQWTETTVRMNVTHQTGAYPELFNFVHNSVMILSVHLTDTKPNEDDDEFWKAEWESRMEANIDWVWTSIKNYIANFHPEEPLRGLIIVGHGQYSKDVREFFVGISELFLTEIHGLRKNFPVLYLHGDGHKWDFNTRVSSTLNWYNFWDIQVDQGANADPCIVEIASQRNDGTMIPLTKQHDLQYVFGNGLFRIDRQRGLYAEDNDEIQK